MSDRRDELAAVMREHDDVTVDAAQPRAEFRCICGVSLGSFDEGLDDRGRAHQADALMPLVERWAREDKRAGAEEHECVIGPLCDGWPFAIDDAYRTIASVSWPGERKENRDAWAVTMRHRPKLFEREASSARRRLDAAIAHGRTALGAGEGREG